MRDQTHASGTKAAVAATAGRQQQRQREHDDIQLPLVIRPRALRLHDIELRARRDAAFARALHERPSFCATLARGILLRDPQARARFRDDATLTAHLRALRAG